MNAALTRLKALLPKSSFARNVAILAGGTAAGQSIVVLASPVITRLYSPEEFGVLAVYTSLLGILSVVASLRYELAIPLPEEDTDAASLLVLSLGIVVFMSLFIGVGIWILGDYIIRWFNTPALHAYLWLLPLGVLMTGVYQVFNYWAIRKKAFSHIAKTKLNQGIGLILTQIALGLYKLGPLGLILGQIAGQAAGSSTLAAIFRRENSQAAEEKSFASIRKVAGRYKRFPLLSSGSALINSAGLQLPALLLAAFYGPQVAGWFALAQRVIGIPMSLVGQAVAQVYMGEASWFIREKPAALSFLFSNAARKLFFLGLLPIIILMISGPRLFAIVFGPNWWMAGLYMRILGLMYLVQFVVVPLSQTLNLLERQDIQLGWDIGRLLLVPGIIVIAHLKGWLAEYAVGVYGIAMLVFYAVLYWLSLCNLKKI